MPAALTALLRPPRLRTAADEDEERHATWYELYFDLVFVAAVAQLATALSRELTLVGFARFAGLFVPVAWAWAGFTFYANRFDTDDVAYRLVKAGAMLAIAAVAISVHSVMRGGTARSRSRSPTSATARACSRCTRARAGTSKARVAG